MKFLCIGDSCTDIFLYGDCKRICPEAPVPVFNPVTVTSNDGMAGNVYRNLLALGVEADLETNKEAIIKRRYIDQKSNQMLVRVDEGDSVQRISGMDHIDFSKYDAVLVSDYDKGFLSEDDIEEVSYRANLCFLDTKKVLGLYAADYKFIKINEPEFEYNKRAGLNPAAWQDSLIITKGEKGCEYKGKLFPAKENIAIRDISGAGDTFFAALAVKYVETKDIEQAIIFANECAGIVVQKRGVVTI